MAIEDVVQGGLAAFEKALRDAYNEGFVAGRDNAREALLQAVAVALPPSTPFVEIADALPAPIDSGIDEGTDEDDDRGGAARAPRGLTSTIVRQVLEGALPLDLEEIQRRALALDDRLNAKTVYNELYRGLGEKYIKDDRSRWLLKPPPPVDMEELTDAPAEREEEGDAINNPIF